MPAGIVARLNSIIINDGTQTIQLASFLREAAVQTGPDRVEDTSMSDSTHTAVPGLLNAVIRATVKVGYGAGSPEDILSDIIMNAKQIAVEAKPTSAAAGPGNPAFRFGNPNVSPPVMGAYIVGPDYRVMGGRVGELVESAIEIVPFSGTSLVRVEI